VMNLSLAVLLFIFQGLRKILKKLDHCAFTR
jgi:hypothetical protein